MIFFFFFPHKNNDDNDDRVNNCVGAQNQKYFVQFCAYIFLASALTLSLVVREYLMCESRGTCFRQHSLGLTKPMVQLGLSLECLVFGLFTCIMSCDQVCSIYGGTGTIEKKQQRRRQYSAAAAAVRAKTGSDSDWNAHREADSEPPPPPLRPTGMSNLRQVFGNTGWVGWVLPVSAPRHVHRAYAV